MAFGDGSKIIMPLKNEAGLPLNGFEVAQNVAEVLAYNPSIRYIGMSVYCIDEKATYRFKQGVADADFVIDNDGKQIDIEKTEDKAFTQTITINGTDENIETTKTTQKIGEEEVVILIANQDSSDGTTVKAGDVISITKTISGIETYNFDIFEDNEIYNPFE